MGVSARPVKYQELIWYKYDIFSDNIWHSLKALPLHEDLKIAVSAVKITESKK